MLRQLCFALIAFLSLLGCDSGEDWIVYNEVEIAGDWNQEDTIRLALTPTEEGSSNVYLKVTHTPDFKYENIYLKYILFQQGKVISEEMVSIPLMSVDGLWTGAKLGKNYSANQLIGTFDMSKPLTLEVQQHSRDSRLAGVKAIGVGVQ